MAKTCGAKTRSGGRCKAPAMANGRCRVHGGASTGAPKSNKNAAKPGSIYSAYLTDEEKAIAADLRLGNVDEELRLTRIRLMRALKLESERADTAELDSEVERDGAENVTAKFERHLKVRDYAGLIDRLTARIAMLEKTRSDLIKDKPLGDEDDMIRDDTVILKPDEPIPDNPIV